MASVRRLGICLGAGVAAVVLTTEPAASRAQPTPPVQGGGGRGGARSIVTIEPERPPATGSGAISGIVSDASTGRPVSGALVQVSGGPPGGPRPRQMTDDLGRFLFTLLPAPADYGLSAVHPDYQPGGYSASPGEAAARIALGEHEWFAAANIYLSRPASLSGTVVDERGEPVVGVPVRILRSVAVAGQVRRAVGPVAETDDRGMYRVAGLRPGTYVVHVPSVQITLPDGAVRAPIPPQRPLAMTRARGGLGTVIGHFPTSGASGRGYPMAYHPAARSADEAIPITLASGQSRSNVDVHLTLVPTVRVSGRLTGAPEAIAGLPVWLVPAGDEASGPGGEVAITMSDGSGAFTFLNAPTGTYTLLASRSQSEYSVAGGGLRGRAMPERADLFNFSMPGGFVAGAPGVAYATRGRAGAAAFGRVPIVVEQHDVSDVIVPVASGGRVAGHFLWDGRPEAPDSVSRPPIVGLEPADGDLLLGFPQSAFVPPTGEALHSPVPFTIDGVLPGRYLLGTLLTPGDFWVEGAEWRGRDLLSSPLEVTGDAAIDGVVVRLSTRATRITGTVTGASGTPVAGGLVIAFPAASSAWETIGLRGRRFRSTGISATGTYSISHVPPGDYLVAAISAADQASWLDREFLSAVAATATRLRVEPGATVTQHLRAGDRR